MSACVNCDFPVASAECRARHARSQTDQDNLRARRGNRFEEGTVLIVFDLDGEHVWLRTYQEGGYDGWTNERGDQLPCGADGSPEYAPARIAVEPVRRPHYLVAGP